MTSKQSKVQTSLPRPVKRDSRICFGIAYFASEADAATYSQHVHETGRTYNGGYFDGMSCGRDKSRDYIDKALGQLYAVTC